MLDSGFFLDNYKVHSVSECDAMEFFLYDFIKIRNDKF